MKKYGKPSVDWLNNRPEFFSENERLINRSKRISEVYRQQPKRTKCKVCKTTLGTPDFSIIENGICICECCGHLNGVHEDSDYYCSVLYDDGGLETYAEAYRAQSGEEYQTRLNDIYQPKADFLVESLKELRETPEDLTYCDWGCGSGHFLGGLQNCNCNNSFGYEVSTAQLELGNKMLVGEPIKSFTLNNDELLSSMDVDVLSMIFVLEHVQDPWDVFKRIKENTNIKYFYFSVPVFSFTTYLESIFQDVMPRTLTPEHTHIFSNESIDYIVENMGFEKASEWWFGTSMIDLYRSMILTAAENGGSRRFLERFSDKFVGMLDDMQLVLDKNHASSEVHMLLSCNK